MVLREWAIASTNLYTGLEIQYNLNSISGPNAGLPGVLILLGYVLPDAMICGAILYVSKRFS